MGHDVLALHLLPSTLSLKLSFEPEPLHEVPHNKMPNPQSLHPIPESSANMASRGRGLSPVPSPQTEQRLSGEGSTSQSLKMKSLPQEGHVEPSIGTQIHDSCARMISSIPAVYCCSSSSSQ